MTRPPPMVPRTTTPYHVEPSHPPPLNERLTMNTDPTQCPHPNNMVSADILEGDVKSQGVQWCRVCGAYRRVFMFCPPGEWNLPLERLKTHER